MALDLVFAAALQVFDGRDWVIRESRTVRGQGGDSAASVAVDYGLENDPGGDDWRVAVWEGPQVDTGAEPAATAGPLDVRRRPSSEAGWVGRAGRRQHRTRVTGPVSEVVTLIPADRVTPGRPILVTQDRNNSTAPECRGPLYPAGDPTRAQAATVLQRQVLECRGEVTVTLVTDKGEVHSLRPNRGIRPAA